jgi:hypothetical protein
MEVLHRRLILTFEHRMCKCADGDDIADRVGKQRLERPGAFETSAFHARPKSCSEGAPPGGTAPLACAPRPEAAIVFWLKVSLSQLPVDLGAKRCVRNTVEFAPQNTPEKTPIIPVNMLMLQLDKDRAA